MNEENTIKSEAFSLTLSEYKSTLRLGTDAVLLSAYIRSDSTSSAVELGAGNGSISLLLAKRGAFRAIHAIEIQKELCEVMRENIAGNALDGRVIPVCADVRSLDPERFKGAKTVFANPPYMKDGCGKSSPLSSRQIARHEVFGGVSDFCRAASKILKTGGRLYLVYRPDRLETLMRALSDSGFTPKRMTFVHSDTEHSPSSVLIEATLGGGESLTVTPPLILRNGDGYSEDYGYIYSMGRFPERFFVR